MVSDVLNDFTDGIVDLYHALKKEIEEKAFYDILKDIAIRYI
ncbi:MAG: hypothetical protein AB8V10_05785 [Francisella endosymbiont of Hyalomma asiaticum]